MDKNRADFILDEHLKYLDRLQERGIARWFGAAALQDIFYKLTRWQAKEVLRYWSGLRVNGEKLAVPCQD